MILSGKTIEKLQIIRPTLPRTREFGMTYGLGPAGYDMRVDLGPNKNDIHYLTEPDSPAGVTEASYIPTNIPYCWLNPGEFMLAATMEKFHMPKDVMGIVHDKSTWARRGLAAQNTVIEPGWRGYLTLELTNHSAGAILIKRGMPIVQVVFHQVDQMTEGYEGKYQDQERGPVEARHDKS